MKHSRRQIMIGLIAVFCLILAQTAVYAEGTGLRTLLTGEFGFPVSISISSPTYQKLARFGEERLVQLNRLLKHFSVITRTDGKNTETDILIDEETVYSVLETVQEKRIRQIYSIDPDTVYIRENTDGNEDTSAVNRFQNHDFFPLNHLIDEARNIFENVGKTFSEFSKEEKVSLNYRAYGKAVRKITIRFPKEYVDDNFPSALASCAPENAVRLCLEKLMFEGVQRIILVYNEDDHLIRVSYDGYAGLAGDSLRKVSLTWKCLRTDDRMMDELTLKTPAVKGYDKYNLSYMREYDMTDPENQRLNWKMDLDRREGTVRKMFSYNANLGIENAVLAGQITYSEKGEGQEKRTVFIPSVTVSDRDEYSGTLEIQDYSGKIVTSDIVCNIYASRCEHLQIKEPKNAAIVETADADGRDALKKTEEKIAVQLIRRMMKLPKDDIIYLSDDIPDDVWNTLTQSLF